MCFYFSHLTCTFHFNCCLNKIFVIVIVIVIVKHDIKRTWAVIDETLHRKKRESPSHIFFHNGKSLKDSQEIAKAFNEYFISIGPSLTNIIKGNNHYIKYLKYPTVSGLKLEPIVESKTRKLIEHLKNKTGTGIYGVSNKLIKIAVNELVLYCIVL